jgi:hypothetical protein
MIPAEKIRDLHRLLKKGEPEGEIRENLKREGYSEDEIKEVFKPHQYDMRSWYLLFGVLVTLFGLYLLVNKGGFLVLILGALLFLAYANEMKRLGKKQ